MSHEILLDMRWHANVTAWAAIWRVLHGTAFMPSVQIKFQLYCCICTSVFFVSSAIDSFAETILSSLGSSATLPVHFKITSLVRLILFTLPIVAQTLLAFVINLYPAAYSRALNHAIVSATASAAALRLPSCGVPLEQLDARDLLRSQLETSCALMSAVKDEVESSADVEPMRVLFLKAKPEVVSILTSGILVIVAVQLRGLNAVI
mmetsp:Transcript_96443/g.155600  ORF Transcript_96443/g.155600 Transcript_96443/m.155600 type:complete len:206 (+) Transcript_96443:10-627(+)